MIDIVVVNAYNLWLVKTGNHTTLRQFQKKIITQILEKYGVLQPTVQNHPPLKGNLIDFWREITSLVICLYLIATPPGAKRRLQRRCQVCINTTKRRQVRKDVTTWCQEECGTALCVPCFKEYHTLKTYCTRAQV